MSLAKTVHQCLFCPQTFDSAAEKDDHILEHFAQEKCLECNRNLIRIAGKLYTLHDSNTCIKTNLKLEPSTFTEDIQEPAEKQNDLIVVTPLPKPDVYEKMVSKEEPTIEDSIEHFVDETSDIELDAIQIKEECINDVHMEMQQAVFTEQLQTDQHIVENDNLPTCSKITSSDQSSHSPKPTRKTGKRDGEVNSLQCDICLMTFSHRYNVKRHKIYFHSPPGTIICKICITIFESQDALAQHRIQCYEKKKNLLNNPKIHIGKTFECYICHKVANSRRQISSHMMYLHVKYKKQSDQKHQCSWCGKVFNRASLFREHENIHTRAITYTCSYDGCGKTYTAKSSLSAHIRHIHEGLKRYQCRIDGCGQSFGGINGFKKHKRDAHGIPFVEKKRKTISRLPMSPKYYMCPYEECKKIFVHHSSRYKHVKEVHEGLKKFKCKINGCEYTFGGKVGLRNHKRDVHGVQDDLLY